MAEEKRRWLWVKEKLAEAVVNVLTAGVLLLVGWAVLQAFLGDYREDKLRQDVELEDKRLRQEIIQSSNDAVKREALLLKRIEELAGALDLWNRQRGRPENPEPAPAAPVQEQRQEQRQAPPDARMNWIDRYEQNVIQQQQR